MLPIAKHLFEKIIMDSHKKNHEKVSVHFISSRELILDFVIGKADSNACAT